MTKKTTKPVRKSNAGRKFFDGKDAKEVVAKLKQAAALDATVGEMCFYAEITSDSYYRYCKANEGFRKSIEALREKPVLKARQTIVNGLDFPENARWYLERKRKTEFSTRQEIEQSGKVENVFTFKLTTVNANNKLGKNRKTNASLGNSKRPKNN